MVNFKIMDELFSMIIEDTGKVTYAYLLEDTNIVSDLWLRNNWPTPELIDWKDRVSMPFMNPLEYINSEKPIGVINSKSNISIKWNIFEDPLIKVQAIIYIDEILIGVLRYGVRPGWSSLVKKDGPLAKKIDIEILFGLD